MEIFYLILQNMWFFAIPLLVVALGGMFSERSGIVNIALEGIMLFGAFWGCMFLYWTSEGTGSGIMSGQLQLILALLIAGGSGALYSLLHAYASIDMNADQTISGTALNLFSTAFVIFFARLFTSNHVQQIKIPSTSFHIDSIPLLSKIPFIGPLLFENTYITTYIGIIILVIAWFVLYKTRFGLRLISCGEFPQAADAAGISVRKMRYAGVIISGFLAGMGGLIFIIPTSVELNGTVAGYGFLALAVLIFGQWKPLRIFYSALFFGFMKTIASVYMVIPFLANLGLPSQFYKMIPYIATIIVLAISSKNSHAPAAEGIPFDSGKR